ncbi:MAG: DASS family sodium-coupled anion symporter [Gemmatimonadales bacterium]|nr:MAG: DASS family sodium-coupled anion symporter [Gemmatimonadales bacterium]
MAPTVHREDPRPESESHPDDGDARRRLVGLILGPLFLVLSLLLPTPGGMEPEAWRAAGLALLMATWWITEAIPIPATALLPLVLIPALELGNMEEAAAPFANPIIFLFMGGFLLAQAVQRCGLHRRAALHLLAQVGSQPARLVGGFMLVTALLSMWLSNTATAVLMLPVGLSVVALIMREDPRAPDDPRDLNFAVALMLGIAYGATIGGAATLIGTPPNAILAGFMADEYGIDVGFARWMLIGVPLAVVMLPLTWVILTRLLFPVGNRPIPDAGSIIRTELEGLEEPSRAERRVAVVFVLTAVAWIARPVLERGLPWLTDEGIAIAAALVLFLLPVDRDRERFALDWPTARKIPWNVLILFGGGLSLAGAITRSGLADWVGGALSGIEALPLLFIMGVVTLVIIFVTELTSNTASAAAFLPVVASLAGELGQDPLVLAIPAALGASCAFMLPVATPPNAVVFGSRMVRIPQMARAGVVFNLLFALAIPLLAFLLVGRVFPG